MGYRSGSSNPRNCGSAGQPEGTLLRAASDEQFGAQARQPSAAQLNGSGELKTCMPDQFAGLDIHNSFLRLKTVNDRNARP